MITKRQKIVISSLIALVILATIMIFAIPLVMSLPGFSTHIAHLIAIGYGKAHSIGWVFVIICTLFLVLAIVHISILGYCFIDFIRPLFSKGKRK